MCSTKLAKRVITQQVPTLVHKGPKIIKRKIDNPQEVQVARRYGKFLISENKLLSYIAFTWKFDKVIQY